MYLLYLDESGLHSSPYFVLAGLAVFETHTGPLSSEVERVLDHYLPAPTRVEPLRATAVRSGSKPPWTQLSQGCRWSLLDEAYEVIRNSRAVLFGVAIERNWLPAGEDEYLFAIESVARRFDGYLQRRAGVEAVAQRGIIVAAESQFRQRIETLALRIQQEGTRSGEVGNLAEVPLFTSAANSRMLQLADLCANAIHARYATGHARHFDRIAARFDVTDGVFQSLWHASRGLPNLPMPWLPHSADRRPRRSGEDLGRAQAVRSLGHRAGAAGGGRTLRVSRLGWGDGVAWPGLAGIAEGYR